MTGADEGDRQEGYRAPLGEASAELREKGSRFLALVLPAADEEEARERRAELDRRYPDASHHCWASRIGQPPIERSSDAGEPHGTAGAPILQSLRGAALSDVLAVVVRWFGGTRLGKGGLARAYGGAVRAALEELTTVERVPVTRLEIEVDYASVGAIQRLVNPPAVKLEDSQFGERARLVLEVERRRLAELRERLAELGVEAHEQGGEEDRTPRG